MKLVCISDTHGSHRELKVPKGDVLIHCGDFCNHRYNMSEVLDFKVWLSKLPHKHKIVVAGNHDGYMEEHGNIGRMLFNDEGIYYLENSEVILEGHKFWGSPYTPEFMNWHFMKKRGEEITRVWEQIPSDVNVLITHGPPKGILDRTIEGEHVGCEDLLQHVKGIRPAIHVFGHIHDGYGEVIKHGVHFINCASMNEDYVITNKPIEATIV